ncbi:hypothetical protein [Ruminococcus sp.]|uniref:hypothetical protein n=1 Tax=Ruminococcus sp. TaxID=41978 RepID=UPI002CFB46F1|nr:hypothetical protein [Ruminococcus sp.]HNZ98335.1 hypothetical protein [Ruminococcus sp.]
MKKLISLSAALAIASGAISMSAGAAYEDLPQNRLWDEEIESFAAMNNGEIPLDINGDGEFTLDDCIIFYGYTKGFDMGEEYTEPAEAVGDITGDGLLTGDDGVSFLRYYITKNPLIFSDLDIESYGDYGLKFDEPMDNPPPCHHDGMIHHVLNEDFVLELKQQCVYLKAGYPMYCELVENGTIDPDINADGQCDLTDIAYFWLASLDNHLYMNREPDTYVIPEFSDEIAERTENIYAAIEGFNEWSYYLSPWTIDYTMLYCFEHGNVTGDMITPEFFDSVAEGLSDLGIHRDVTTHYYELVPQNDPYIDFNVNMYDREYRAFVQAVKDGEKERPDTNGDGVLNSLDAFNVYIYTCELRKGVSEERTILPADVFDLFKNNMDVNGNGLSGDMNDLTIIDLYIAIEDKSIEEMDETSDNYIERLNEYAGRLTSAKNMLPVKFSPDGIFESLGFDADVERSGDANNDGSTDLADAIYIMQSLANPDKYQLSPLGKFNGDVEDTGNGITNYDALEIQSRLLNL